MCGIAGFAARGSFPGHSGRLLRELTETLVHRGPDGSGLLGIDGNGRVELAVEKGKETGSISPDLYRIGFGHRRLSIIDLESGAQPLCNEDQTVWVTYNGEIYNHRELRKTLEGLGHRFKTDHSDTEVLVHGWEQWGEELPKHLDGMFAFAIYDSKAQTLFLARDQIGIKPLYWQAQDQWVAFGSELKAMMPLQGRQARINPTAIQQYLLMGYVPAPISIFEGIHKLLPGHCIRVDLREEGKEVLPQRYWDPSRYRTRAASDGVGETEALLRQVVRSHLDSDVSFGAFLSGGTDSSLITALMKEELSSQVQTFTIGFKEKDFDESGYARQVAEVLGTRHHEKTVYPDAVSLLPLLAKHFDEPFSDISAIPTYLVSKLAAENVKMVLSGDGGDELYWGYARYQQAENFRKQFALLDQVPASWRSTAISALSSGLPTYFKGARMLRRFGLTPFERYEELMQTFNRSEVQRMWKGEERVVGSPLRSHVASLDNWQGSREECARLDLVTYLPEDILTKVDRMSMAVSLETRVPLLDHRTVELALQSDSNLKVRDGKQKWALKHLLEKRIPSSLVHREKMGFGVPFGTWVRQGLEGWIRERLLTPRAAVSDWMDTREIQRLLDAHIGGRFDGSPRLWNLMVLEESLENLSLSGRSAD